MSLLARRLDHFQESVIREMTRKAIENDAINLSQGMPDFNPPDVLIKGIEKAIEIEEHQYSVTYGRRDLRDKIAEKLHLYNNLKYDPENEITVTCGASEAISCSIMATMNPGEEILIPEPWYENYVPITYLAGGKPVFVPLGENDFSLVQEKLKESITPKTKAIVLNSPHNPTGKVFSKEEMNFIADICQDNNLIAITDEIYEYILYDDVEHISLASLKDMHERTITISGFSKTFSITGWRLGYAAAERELMIGVRKVHDYLTVCAPSPLQYAALESFNLKEDYFVELKERYKTNRDFLTKELNKLRFKIFIPSGAYYVFADISAYGKTDTEFADFLVKDKGVATVPGTSFYEQNKTENAGKRYVRFSYSQKLETIKEAIERIKIRVRNN
ncbi:MAG: pyridoxal phosphate-dependent aminotransferase [Candidatus Heimdallarchaeota archaeon]|nr:pyridoxal phosphate-dependent aminotransferase [Candidatus Heimdallarchaeota archaeon]